MASSGSAGPAAASSVQEGATRPAPVKKMGTQHVKGTCAKEIRAHQVRQRALSKAKKRQGESPETGGSKSYQESSPEWEAVGMMTDDETDPEQDVPEPPQIQKDYAEGKSKIKREPILAAWHRVVGRLMYTTAIKMAMMTANMLCGEAVPQAQLECDHPQWARRPGGNQYAKYEHCKKCKGRLWIERRSRQEQIDLMDRAQQRRNEQGARGQARAQAAPLKVKEELVYLKEVVPKKKKTQFETAEAASKAAENVEIARALQENNQVLQQMAEAVRMLAGRSSSSSGR